MVSLAVRSMIANSFPLMPGSCPIPWETYACDWGIGYLWPWMNWLGHLDIAILALMLARVVVIVMRSSHDRAVVQHAEPDISRELEVQGSLRRVVADRT